MILSRKTNRVVGGEDSLKDKRILFNMVVQLACAVIGIFAALGFTDVSMLMTLKKHGVSDAVNSMNLSLYLVGFSLGCFFMVPFLKRYSPKLLIFCVIGGVILSLIFFALADYIALLICWYFIQGACSAVVLIIFSHLTTAVSNFLGKKALFISAFVSFVSAGYLVGIVGVDMLSKFSTLTAFIFVALFTSLLSVPLLTSQAIHSIVKSIAAEMIESPVSFFTSLIDLTTRPLIFFSILMYGINNSITVHMLAIWGIDCGYNQERSILLGTPILIGGILLPFLFTKMHKHFGNLKTALLYTVALTLCVGLLHIIVTRYGSFHHFFKTPLFFGMPGFPLFFLIGGIIIAFKSLYLYMLSDELQGALLAASFAGAYCIAHSVGIVVNPICGLLITKFGPYSFGLFLISVYALLTGMLFLQMKHLKIKSGPALQQ